MTGIIIVVCLVIFIFALIRASNSPCILPLPEPVVEPVREEPAPDVSEPVVSLIASILAGEWTITESEVREHYYYIKTWLYTLGDLAVEFRKTSQLYDGYNRLDCFLPWATRDERIALVEAHEQHIEQLRINKLAEGRATFMVLVKK